MRMRSRISCIALVTLLSAGMAFAQSRATTADLSGTVTDASGAALPGATVTAVNRATNATRAVVTERAGRFAFPALPPGAYTVTVALSGFTTQVFEDVALALGSAVGIDSTLQIEGQREQVTVRAVAPLIDTQRAAVSTVVSQEQIEALPINGRNFISFSVITPGATTDRTPLQGGSAATSGISFAGQSARSNNITVDGLDNNDTTIGSVRATFSQEAVQEFQVVTNSYSAEFGKASGGVVNIVTKSGTNDLSGNLFFFFRDDSLNARGHFEKFNPAGQAIQRVKAPYDQKQFGGTLGGPIKRDRAFFFLSFERLDVEASNFVTIDDTNIVTLAGQPLGTPAAILRRSGFPVETGNVPFAVKSNQLLAKLDHQVKPEHALTLRLNWAGELNENVEPFGGLVARSRGAVLDSTDVMVAASYSAVLSPKTVNDLRIQVASRDQAVRSLDPSCDGACDREDEGGPTIDVSGFASVGRHQSQPQLRKNVRYQVVETLSHYTHSHQIKAGVDFNYIAHQKQTLPLNFGGRYVFAALPAVPGIVPTPVTAIQALGLGLPATYVQGYGSSSVPYNYADVSVFLQDDWRIVSNFTLKAGVRYQKQFWPNTKFRVDGVGEYTTPPDSNDLAPRVGFTWDPWSDRKTSIHGAWGLFFSNQINGIVAIAATINGAADGVRTLVLPFPRSISAWNAPGHRLSAEAAGSFPSLALTLDPDLKTPYAHHVAAGIDRALPGDVSLSANFVYVRGYNQLGTIDYNPVVPSLGPLRRPLDVDGRAGTSASVLQYTSFAETWYRGMTVAVSKRFDKRYGFLASYTLSKAEDNSTDFRSAFIPQDSGTGRDPQNLKGLPIGFDAGLEKGPATHDQRHRFVLSGVYVAPLDVQLSTILTVGSGRPYNVLAGADLNGDGSSTSDRARRNPADPASSLGRNTGLLPSQAAVDLRVSRRFGLGGGTSLDAIVEAFNLFNRTNFTEINGVFGRGAYPDSPLPAFGQFLQAGAPRQIQLALKLRF